MVEYEWNEEQCRRYAEALRPVAKYDHRRWAGQIAAELPDLPPGASVVDVATGPGFLLLELARLLREPRLTALDPAAPMLRIVEEEAAAAALSVTTVESPAEEMGLEDGSADVLTCKQLLHEARDVPRVLAEMVRVVRPGGRAFVIDFDADGSRLAARVIRTFMRVTRGREIAASFWKSFEAGLPGAEVAKQLTDAGMGEAEYRRAGPNYFLVCRR